MMIVDRGILSFYKSNKLNIKLLKSTNKFVYFLVTINIKMLK